MSSPVERIIADALDVAGVALARAEERRARAEIAEQFPAHTHPDLATAPVYAAEQAADEIAAAIRARGDA
jgi:uncharacterized protein (DUF433 family)